MSESEYDEGEPFDEDEPYEYVDPGPEPEFEREREPKPVGVDGVRYKVQEFLKQPPDIAWPKILALAEGILKIRRAILNPDDFSMMMITAVDGLGEVIGSILHTLPASMKSREITFEDAFHKMAAMKTAMLKFAGETVPEDSKEAAKKYMKVITDMIDECVGIHHAQERDPCVFEAGQCEDGDLRLFDRSQPAHPDACACVPVSKLGRGMQLSDPIQRWILQKPGHAFHFSIRPTYMRDDFTMEDRDKLYYHRGQLEYVEDSLLSPGVVKIPSEIFDAMVSAGSASIEDPLFVRIYIPKDNGDYGSRAIIAKALDDHTSNLSGVIKMASNDISALFYGLQTSLTQMKSKSLAMETVDIPSFRDIREVVVSPIIADEAVEELGDVLKQAPLLRAGDSFIFSGESTKSTQAEIQYMVHNSGFKVPVMAMPTLKDGPVHVSLSFVAHPDQTGSSQANGHGVA
jgi:hypothetical protein